MSTAPRPTLPDLLELRAAEPERAALARPDGTVLTYGAWQGRAAAVAGGLRDRGTGRGDRVGLLFGDHDWLDYAVAFFGVLRAGAVAVPLSPRWASGQLRDVMAGASVSLVIGGEDRGRPAVGLGELAAGRGAPNLARPEDLAQILYTSGTTGRSRGVGATHANLAYEPAAYLADGRRSLAHSRHFLHAFPICGNAGQTTLAATLATDAVGLVAGRFDPEGFGALISAYRVGTVFAVPAMAIALLAERIPDRHDLSSVQMFGSTGAALPPAVALELAEALPGAVIVNTYSSTESAPARTSMVFDPARPAAVGRAVAGTPVRITDEAGTPLPSGAVGRVWLRSPVPRSYVDRPAAGVFEDGWVRMGDLGLLDDGLLYLVDREPDLIESGGLTVSTLEVEAALHEHPDVIEAAVLGVPHPDLGRAVAAAVVTRSATMPADLRAALAARLGAHEIPTRWARLDRLPRNDSGKMVKGDLLPLFPDEGRAPPAARTEVVLAGLWQTVLGIRGARPDDGFLDLGGDSLRALHLSRLTTEAFGVRMPVSVIFERPLFADQVRWVDDQAGRTG
ncbi:non-ribosomal peptide synthetase [Actinomadura sp. DC4]|uniref:non-ribosomal peptide synthetase n=1 Tax=Actinomadura sp. DC4 TaxID=3055069 RepID=UPI0025B13887|nr:non-ribosomal peptide synthetase [Actinomadura sp. DC4]MDN3358596.1 non-ribosomal peptide synthetase [Actinomadura sp. DC4]